jgi:hypothetical protein
MAELLVMNGTNNVGMNGTNSVGMNGTNNVGMNGYRMNGTNYVNLNGFGFSTNEVQLDGTNSVTLNGVNVENLSPYDIDLDNINGTEEDLDLLRLAIMYGDPAAIDTYETGDLNGLKEVLAARKARIAAETPAQKAARTEKRQKLVSKLVGAVGLVSPGAAGVLKNLTSANAAKAASIATQTAAALEDAGIEPNTAALATRAAQQTDAGLDENVESAPKGLSAWWAGRSKTEKTLIIGGGVAVAGLALYMLTKKKKGKKRR